MTVQTFDGFLLTRNWRDTRDGIELEYWFATDSGPLCALVRGERSVFFLEQEEVEQARPLLDAEPGLELKPVQLRSFRLVPVVGVYCPGYRQARRLADALETLGLNPLEADINPADRFLMERFVTGGVVLQGEPRQLGRHILVENPAVKAGDYRPALKVVSFDIETAMEGVQLFSIGVHGRVADRHTRRVFMVGEGAQQDFVQSCADQEAVLQAFLDWLADYDPDVLIGWNVVNFDTWYLQRVADKLGRRLVLGRDRRAAHWRELDDEGERRAVQCPGRVILDGIELLRAAFYRFESFSLDNVAHELLGEGKLLHGSGRGEEIGLLFQRDKTRLAEYNLKDCELVSQIFEHTAMLDFAVARTVMTGLNIDRMGGSVASFDNLYLPRLHRRGFVAPNASADHSASPGGFVLDSTPGLYDHVLVLDFKSLYPSIIRTFCIDPLGLALAAELPEPDTVPGFREARFAREGHILPQLIEQLWQQRDEAKRQRDAPLSQAIKIIMNSFYGVLGTPGCRFFDARLASSITLRGHQILTRTRDYIERGGHRVIYGDTDSVFVWIREAGDDAEAVAAGKQLQHDLNAWWSRTVREEFGLESVLEVEFETHYKRFLMPTVRGSDKGSKKRYAGVVAGPDGDRLVFKGLENVRTDWTRVAREFQEELYRRIFMQEPFEDYVRELVAGLLAGRHDEQLVYRKRLRRRLNDYERNVPPHVQAARLCAGRGLPVPTRGGWVEYVITTGGAEPVAAALAPLDYQHYVDRQLEPVADGILGFVGSSFRTLVDKQIDLF
ncbi:MAG: DNA polymerase II [Halieaceae bacterium]|nr:DNA polymerase II [Halieaceae bacterium]